MTKTQVSRVPAIAPAAQRLLACLLVLVAVTAAYSNHFHNGFHFDDFYAITDNVYLRDLNNLPRLFTDATTSSSLPANRQWRPLVTASHAIDYAIAGGYNPVVFQVSTFVWFVAQLCLMYLLFAMILARVRPGAAAGWAALGATAFYGLHPAMAETVNYIVQRAEVISTCGVVGALYAYIRWPAQRKYALYLVPFAVGLLGKAPAVVFPALLMGYIALFEETPTLRGLRAAALRAVPAIVVAGLYMWLVFALTPKTFTPGAPNAQAYLITQPYVAFRYFTTFLLPTHLSLDSDLAPLSTLFTLEAFGGFAFMAAMIFVIAITARSRQTRPICFGLAWFVVALAPTSLFPLAEVENDHRLYFPFVGLVLAMTWTVVLLLPRALSRTGRVALIAGLACLFAVSALGTHRRNDVWASDERLWEDVTVKSPRNGRGLMNYGLAVMSRGDYPGALRQFERAREWLPAYPILEINLAVANAALQRREEAERHFLRALQLEPSSVQAHFFYARWLRGEGRLTEAERLLRTGLGFNPADMGSRYLLLAIYVQRGRPEEVRVLVADSLAIAPADPEILRYKDANAASLQPTADTLLDESLALYRARDFAGSLRAANAALQVKPDSATAYNNVAAAHAAMQQWDEAIAAAREAIRLQPDFQLARNNLAWAESARAKALTTRP